MIMLFIIGGIIAFSGLIALLMVDPSEPKPESAELLDTPAPVPTTPEVSDNFAQPARDLRPTRTQPAFFEQIGHNPTATRPTPIPGNRSPYVVDLSNKDAQRN